jgi:hypothetical protein
VDVDEGLVVDRRGEDLGGAAVGIVVLRGISRVNTPPAVSTPSDSGVTSSSSTSSTSPVSTPAWIAAPTATTSSGLTVRARLLAEELADQRCWIRGIRVWPPTRITASMSPAVEAGVGERALARLERALHERLDEHARARCGSSAPRGGAARRRWRR